VALSALRPQSPDKFAAQLSQAFYTRLIEAVPLGEALHGAKWELLKGACNPLGIFYTLYADPYIQVSEPKQVVPLYNSTATQAQGG
jgi:hypothetical protein